MAVAPEEKSVFQPAATGIGLPDAEIFIAIPGNSDQVLFGALGHAVMWHAISLLSPGFRPDFIHALIRKAVLHVPEELPARCIEMKKWPYDTKPWRDWLAVKEKGNDPAFPD